MIGVLKIPFFVVTLGTLSVYQSIALLSTSGETVSLFTFPRFNEIPTLINGSSRGRSRPCSCSAGALYLIGAFVLRYTSFGRASTPSAPTPRRPG